MVEYVNLVSYAWWMPLSGPEMQSAGASGINMDSSQTIKPQGKYSETCV